MLIPRRKIRKMIKFTYMIIAQFPTLIELYALIFFVVLLETTVSVLLNRGSIIKPESGSISTGHSVTFELLLLQSLVCWCFNRIAGWGQQNFWRIRIAISSRWTGAVWCKLPTILAPSTTSLRPVSTWATWSCSSSGKVSCSLINLKKRKNNENIAKCSVKTVDKSSVTILNTRFEAIKSSAVHLVFFS